ncbi:MAG: hypothetical protein HN348_30135, partial [Proteobacteria bacterium]|nr:hypothetical protein [Pseudomonadota bacterium]
MGLKSRRTPAGSADAPVASAGPASSAASPSLAALREDVLPDVDTSDEPSLLATVALEMPEFGRDLEEFNVAHQQIDRLTGQVEDEGDNYKPGLFRRKKYDYPKAVGQLHTLSETLTDVESGLLAEDPASAFKMSANAVTGTAGKLEDEVPEQHPKKLRVHGELIRSGVPGAVRASFESGAMEDGELVEEEYLGAGAMGIVHEYSYLGLSSHLAGKSLITPDDEAAEALRYEGQLQEEIPQNANLMNAMGTLESGKGPVVIMDLARGGSLQEIINRLVGNDEVSLED